DPVSLQVGAFTDWGFTRLEAGTQERFTGTAPAVTTINWGDGSPTQNVTPSVVQGSPGVLTAGTVTGTHTYTTVGTYTVTVTVPADDKGTGTATLRVQVTDYGASKFFVVDQDADSTFRYDRVGNPAGSSGLAHPPNSRPRGIAGNRAGDTYWVIDATQNPN